MSRVHPLDGICMNYSPEIYNYVQSLPDEKFHSSTSLILWAPKNNTDPGNFLTIRLDKSGETVYERRSSHKNYRVDLAQQAFDEVEVSLKRNNFPKKTAVSECRIVFDRNEKDQLTFTMAKELEDEFGDDFPSMFRAKNGIQIVFGKERTSGKFFQFHDTHHSSDDILEFVNGVVTCNQNLYPMLKERYAEALCEFKNAALIRIQKKKSFHMEI